MKKNKQKVVRPKPINPKGFRDYFHFFSKKRSSLIKEICEVFELYGFENLETPAIENLDALGKYLPDIDRPNQGVFSWKDDESNWLALRYDLTAPLARAYAQYSNELPLPYRRYSWGPVWRNEKPGPGRYRQFYQCDADTVGTHSVVSDAEMCIMLSTIIEKIGVKKDKYILNLNNRKILNGILETAGIGNINDNYINSTQSDMVLRSIDKIDRLGLEGVKDLLGAGRKDESGDFTTGANLNEEQINHIVQFISINNDTNAKTLNQLQSLVGNSIVGKQGIDELQQILEFSEYAGFSEDSIRVNPGTVRGLGYYTGPVFEVELTEKIQNEDGIFTEIGSVAGGGRYDGLVKRFTGKVIPATGFSLGIDRLLYVFNQIKSKEEKYEAGPIIVTIMEKDKIKAYQQIVNDLRNAGIKSELYLGNPKDLGRQLKYADKRRSRFALIMGSEELKKDVIQVKDLELGAKISRQIKTHEEWKHQPAQVEIKRDKLIEYIMKLPK